MKPILVSACLLGLNTRYDGQEKANAEVLQLIQRHKLTAIPICPEQLAGFSTPRSACEFSNGIGIDVINGHGTLHNTDQIDVSAEFVHGATQALNVAKICQCTLALLKERSPSCGVHTVYRNKKQVAGQGVTAALFNQQAITLFSEEELNRLEQYLGNDLNH
ncbi:MAG: DUF523 domain-containing protein [Desulfuromonas sp.]|nr:DUF523 domain-containing protein [Desulfuromonas sp.]